MRNLIALTLFVVLMLISGFAAAESFFCTKADAQEARDIFAKYKKSFDAGGSSKAEYIKKENMLFLVLYCAGEMPKMEYCIKKSDNLRNYRRIHKLVGDYALYVKANEYYFRNMYLLKAACAREMGE
jgi:hypothetical protein